jgi:hypothetical protein
MIPWALLLLLLLPVLLRPAQRVILVGDGTAAAAPPLPRSRAVAPLMM